MTGLWHRLRGENWFRHSLTFVGGIMGIVIGLQLEGLISDAKDRQRLEKFRTLVFNELKSNRAAYVNSKLELDATIRLVKFMQAHHLRKSPLACESDVLDSLIASDVHFQTMINVLQKKGGASTFNANITFSINPPSTNAWEALKVSGSLTDMEPEQIMNLSRTYDMIKTNLFQKDPVAFLHEMEAYYRDREFSDEEFEIILEGLENLSAEFDVKASNIQQSLSFKLTQGVTYIYDSISAK